MNGPAIETYTVVDMVGQIFFARPDENGLLPTGEKSWEMGSIALDEGALVWGDLHTRSEAEALADFEAGEVEREARRAEVEAEFPEWF